MSACCKCGCESKRITFVATCLTSSCGNDVGRNDSHVAVELPQGCGSIKEAVSHHERMRMGIKAP